MLRKLASAAAVAVIVGAFIISATASAKGHQTEQLCAAELEAVEAAINGGAFKNPEKDQTNLLAKLTEAEAKVEEGKTADAVAKLDGIANTASLLASAPKPKLDDASAIEAAVDLAIACLAGR